MIGVMCMLEKYLDQGCPPTPSDMCDRLLNDLDVAASTSSLHRALQGMLYSTKKIKIEKSTMNMTVNKNKRKTFATKRNECIARGDMTVYQDETKFNLYLSRTEGGRAWASALSSSSHRPKGKTCKFRLTSRA